MMMRLLLIALSPLRTAALGAVSGISTCIAVVFALSRWRRITLTIPREGGDVDARFLVHGKAWPPTMPVQVLGYARGSELWYMQPGPKPDGSGGWSANCYFGNEGDGAGGRYKVVAIDGTREIRERSFKSLPMGVRKSRIVSVRRR